MNRSQEGPNWLELPADIMRMILQKLGTNEILDSAQNVCSSWCKLCEDPLMWRVVDIRNFGDLHATNYDLTVACRHVVDLSCGQLIDINLQYFGTDKLLDYIARRSNQLKRLRMTICYDISNRGFTEAVSKLPLLEQLEIFFWSFSVKTLRSVGRCCPLLKTLKLNRCFCQGRIMVSDKEAHAIAQTMPKLRHLQIFGNALTDKGLQAILDGCPDLESLDLRQCFNLKMTAHVGKMCAEKIKILHLPHDPIDDYEFSDDFFDSQEYLLMLFHDDSNDDDDDDDDNDSY